MSKFNKKSLGPAILSLTKSSNEELLNKNFELDEFCIITNTETGEEMIAFTVKEKPEQYFWASTALYNFLSDNLDVGLYDNDSLSYKFEEKVFVTYAGKKALKSDKNITCNIWKINF